MRYQIVKQSYTLALEADGHTAKIAGGSFYDVSLRPQSLFCATLLHPATGRQVQVSSLSHWEKVSCRVAKDRYTLSFFNPEGLGELMFIYTALCDSRGITWQSQVINNDPSWSVLSASYPTAKAAAPQLNVFIPEHSGIALPNVGERPVFFDHDYPSTHTVMQYFAFWGQEGGIYLGYHDPDACQKTVCVLCGDFRPGVDKYIGYYNPALRLSRMPLRPERGEGCVYVAFPGINAGEVENSFALGGELRWEAFRGDWYDATLLYDAFVKSRAKWLPFIDENGRPDTAEKFKEIPFWITDYIPNSPEQMEARPMILGAVSQLYDKNYWFEAPIALKKQLGVPVAYHVYNWHRIPFNINYPHYTPAKEEFFRGADALKEAGLYLMPYINAVSWEEKDADEGFPVNFQNTGHLGAAVQQDGSYYRTEYPQVKRDGTKTQLMPMCPGFATWHRIIEQEARTMEATLPIDGIYFDEVAAKAAPTCYAKNHGHLPGGGSYWSDGYNLMMSKINQGKPKEAFYFTECNAEPYMKSFDGYLTWLWRDEGCVPAFPAIYAGYVQMVGRFTDGVNREDDLLFRYHIAAALLFGQQPGWVNAAVLYREKRMPFLTKMVQLRYAKTALFNSGTLCRPPKVTCSLPAVTSSGLTMEMVQSGAWKMRKGGRVTVFAINVAEEACDCRVTFPFREYGLHREELPKEITVEGDLALWELHLDGLDAATLELGE